MQAGMWKALQNIMGLHPNSFLDTLLMSGYKATSTPKVVMMSCPSESGGGLAVSHSIVLLLADEREVFSFQIRHLDDLTLEFLFYPAFGSKLLVGLSLHCELLICNI